MHKWYQPDRPVFLRHRNQEATEDLIIPVDIVCNTPDETLLANIHTNSRNGRPWVKAVDAHDGIALLCGSGPSLADDVSIISEMQANGAKVFALNAAAKFLDDHGITADYQVICDARAETFGLIGPAKEHYFASQVHPSLFDAVPDATLWHLNIEGEMEKQFPENCGGYALIGGMTSVGNVSLCLAYAMGYRDLHCFGFDSSHRDDASHVLEQPINAGEPLTWVEFNGKRYLSSFTMKSQADTFYKHYDALIESGAKIMVHGSGLLPDMWKWFDTATIEEREQRKYKLMWSHDSYRKRSPGEELYDAVKATFDGEKSLIDFGCGTGRLTQKLANDFTVLGVDFADNCLDNRVSVPFLKANLWDLPADLSADAGVCCDVMEHIPPEKVDAVLAGIEKAVPKCFFRIEFEPDSMGVLIGQPLHLSVHDKDWWLAKLQEHFPAVSYAGDNVFLTGKV